MWHFWLTYICDKRDLTCVIILTYVTEVTYLTYITYVTNAMWHMRQPRCGLYDKCYQCVVTYVTNVMLHIWHTWHMWQTRFDICDIYDICDICDVYGNSDVTYATNAMWVLWQMRSDICDIFDKCDIYDKRNVTYMAYVNFRGWTLQENSLNWLEMSYLKSNQIKSCSCHVYDWLPTQIGLIMNLWKVAHFRSMNMCGMINFGVLLCE